MYRNFLIVFPLFTRSYGSYLTRNVIAVHVWVCVVMMLLASVQMRPSICVSIGTHRKSRTNLNVAALRQSLLCICAMLSLTAKFFRVHVCVATWLCVCVRVCWYFTLYECACVCVRARVRVGT